MFSVIRYLDTNCSSFDGPRRHQLEGLVGWDEGDLSIHVELRQSDALMKPAEAWPKTLAELTKRSLGRLDRWLLTSKTAPVIVQGDPSVAAPCARLGRPRPSDQALFVEVFIDVRAHFPSFCVDFQALFEEKPCKTSAPRHDQLVVHAELALRHPRQPALDFEAPKRERERSSGPGLAVHEDLPRHLC